MTDNTDLDAFEQHMEGLQKRVYDFTDKRYNPTWWEQSRAARGALEAARKLLSADSSDEYQEAQTGFFRLWELKALHLSVEREILKPEYSDLFTEAEKAEARRRLTEVGCTGF